jgi:3-deoxy-D-arabino-heptulosonate 7-phosphate (DAHP) synthase class II
VHLGSVLINNQLDAQLFFRMYLFQFSTCFEHLCAHRQENRINTVSRICHSYVGDRLACMLHAKRSHTHRVTYTRCRIDTIDSPDDEHRGARNM